MFTPKSGVADGKKLYTTYAYQDGKHSVNGSTKTTTTGLVKTYTNKFGNSGSAVSKFDYTYDSWGNITKITDKASKNRTYTYNAYGEVTKATEAYSNGTTTTYTYTYDAGGNIVKEQVGSTTHTYKYDSVWKDKLISYDGKSITYDEAGHPLNYMGTAMSWDVNNNLTNLTKGSTKISYTYQSTGERRSKAVNGTTTTYNYNNGLLLSETKGNETLRYYYDSTGKVTSIGYQKGSAAEVGYFFARNGQGDVIAIYRSSDSKLIGTYEYDLWGRLISVKEASSGIDTNGILTKNPIRYRGYYYDNEIGFYYLQSRYYDPVIRRFISADNLIASPGSSVQGHNLFGYCFNNPVNMSDETGYWPQLSEIFATVAVTSAVVAVSARAVSIGALTISAVAVGVGGAPLSVTAAGVAVTANNVSNVAMAVAGAASLAALGTAAIENTVGKKTRHAHSVYVLTDDSGTVQYVGRTTNPIERAKAHKRNKNRSMLNMEIRASNLSYSEARALEQATMSYYHTINTKNKMNNQINGIAPKFWANYKAIALGTLGYAENQLTNEILYWTENID